MLSRNASAIVGLLAVLAAAPAFDSPIDPRGVLLQACLDAPAESVIAKCVLAQPGVEPIASYTARGDAIVRAFVDDGEGRPAIFVQYVRTAQGTASVDVRPPFASKAEFIFPLSELEWSDVLTAWANLPEEAANGKAQETKKDESDRAKATETICIHGWSADIESNFAKKYEHIWAEACDSPWNYSFVTFLLNKAIAEWPYCAALNAGSFGNAARRFYTCSKLNGNKLLAAEALNAADRLNGYDDHPVGQLPRYDVLLPTRELEAYISPTATMQFSGAQIVKGRSAVAAEWEKSFALLSHPHLDFDSATENGGSVEIVGSLFILDNSGKAYRRFHASFEQIWRRDNSGHFLLTAWHIGRILRSQEGPE